jgi:membrane protein
VSDTVRDRDGGEQAAPEPEDDRKPEGPTDLTRRTWTYVLRKVWREFTDDECPDLAAALTFYAVLAIFPAALALTSLLGLVGQAQTSVDKVVEVLDPLVSEQMLGTVKPALEELASSNAAGWALLLGLAGALWSASGYVNGFSRAMNRIYEIDEGRPFWKLRPQMLLLTIVVIFLVALVLLALIFSGSLARSAGDAIGLGDQALTVWSIAKWPLIVLVVIVIVALLYWATPNVRQPKFRWISIGAAVAIIVWIIGAVGFSFYVANFSSYNKTYGSLAGVIIGLLFLWLTNLALLLGAELDSELERGRELQAGIAAEEELQLPARDTRNIEKAEKKNADDARRGRRIREDAGRRRRR